MSIPSARGTARTHSCCFWWQRRRCHQQSISCYWCCCACWIVRVVATICELVIVRPQDFGASEDLLGAGQVGGRTTRPRTVCWEAERSSPCGSTGSPPSTCDKTNRQHPNKQRSRMTAGQAVCAASGTRQIGSDLQSKQHVLTCMNRHPTRVELLLENLKSHF